MGKAESWLWAKQPWGPCIPGLEALTQPGCSAAEGLLGPGEGQQLSLAGATLGTCVQELGVLALEAAVTERRVQ